MPDRVLLTTLAIHALFLATGALQLGFCLVVRAAQNDRAAPPPNGREAVRDLLYARFPLAAGIANAGLILATFVISLPGLLGGGGGGGGSGSSGGGGSGSSGGGGSGGSSNARQDNNNNNNINNNVWLRSSAGRGWLRRSGYLVALCALFTLSLGLVLWVMTLRIKEDFFATYAAQDAQVQSLIQTSFGCCGYFNASTPAFITDSTCPSPAAAALLRGCSASIASFANIALDVIFTALFGMVGVDVLLILSLAALLKVRKDRERYYHIDQKGGYRQF